MNASPRAPSGPGAASPNALLALGVAICVLLAIVAMLAPRAAAWGWLVAFLVFGSAPIGAVALGAIQVTTGGRWAAAFSPTLQLAALAAPLSAIYFLPLLAGLPALFPWAANGSTVAPDVMRLYLNPEAFAARGLIATVGWGAIGLLLASGRLGLLGAALALAFYGVAISLVANDWCVSLTAGFSDSAFGAEFAVQQILVALALVAAAQPRRAIAMAGGDLGGLLLVAALGEAYLAGMSFIVKWYGDQPIDAAWHLARAHGRELIFLLASIALGALTPIIVCAWERLRASSAAMRGVGIATIAGVFFHDLWLVGPAAPALAGLVAALGMIAMAALACGFALALERRWPAAQLRREATP